MLERDGEHRERSGIAGELHETGRELIACLVVPQVQGDPTREPEPRSVLGTWPSLAERTERPLQQWRGRDVSLREPVASPSSRRSDAPAGCEAGGAACAAAATGPHPAPTGQTPCEHGCGQRFQVGLRGESRVEALEFLGCLEQERRSLAAAVRRKRDLGAQQVHPGPLELVERPSFSSGQQADGCVEGAGLILGRRCGHGATSARGLWSQGRGLLQEGGRRGPTQPRLRPLG